MIGAASGARAQTCAVTTASGNYGNVDVLSGLPTATSSLFTVTCTGTRNATVRLCIGISYGVNYGGSTTQRSLAGASNGLTHDLFLDAAHSQLWGSAGLTGVASYPGSLLTYNLALGTTGAATTPTIPVYGQIYGAQQTAAPGAYTWTSQTPAAQYGYAGAAPCPTGGNTAGAGGTTTWTANVPAKCNVGATTLNFGSHGLLTAAVQGTTNVSVQCTRTTPYSVALSGGGSGSTTARMMTGPGAATIAYSLSRDSARTLNWGSNTGVDTIGGTGTGLAQNLPVYGTVSAQATPAPGVYSDTIIVTVTY
jgi:spore coat protein U-like protein